MLFLQDSRFQGALRHSGVIVPIAHRETVFDLTEAELIATFRLLARVKAWMDAEFAPDGYNVGWNCGRSPGKRCSTPTCTSSRASATNRWPARGFART